MKLLTRDPDAGRGVPEDPRFRARRIEVKRTEARRRLRRLGWLTAAVGLVGTSVALTQSPALDIDHIRVIGATETPEADIVAASGLRRGEPMLDLDGRNARARVAALPWIEAVTVERQWPGTVRIRVTERRPVALIPLVEGAAAAEAPAATHALVDADGRVLEWTATPPDGLAVLGDVEAPPPSGVLAEPDRLALEAVLAFPAGLAPRVASTAATDVGVELRLANGGRVIVGTVDDLPAKLVAARTVLDHLAVDGEVPAEVCVLDVRVPSAPSLTRASPCL